MCTEHGLTRSGLEPTICRTRGEHANDYTIDESLWLAFLVCFSANTYIVQGRIQDFKLGGLRAEGGAKICGVFRVKNHDFTPTNHIFSNFRGGARRVRPPWIRPWLCMQKQVNAITKSCYFQIRNIGRNRSYTTEDACKTLVSSLIASRLDYGNALLYIVNTQHNLEATACSKYSN
jgi:hypothetical protein